MNSIWREKTKFFPLFVFFWQIFLSNIELKRTFILRLNQWTNTIEMILWPNHMSNYSGFEINFNSIEWKRNADYLSPYIGNERRNIIRFETKTMKFHNPLRLHVEHVENKNDSLHHRIELNRIWIVNKTKI